MRLHYVKYFLVYAALAFFFSPIEDIPARSSVELPTYVVSSLRDRGYLGDGSGRTLASRFSSLSAARSVFPSALSLSDTLDWAALQSAIDMSDGRPTLINLPSGVGVINRPLVSGGSALEIVGEGRDASRLVTSSSGIDLFQHGLTKVVYNARFTLRHLSLYVTGPHARYAINIKQDRDSGGFILQDIFIGSYSAEFSWEAFVNGVGTTDTNWRDVVMSGGEYNPASMQQNSTKIGVIFSSFDNSDRSDVYNMDNVRVGAVVHAFKVVIGGTSPDHHGSIEGMHFFRSGGRTDAGAWFRLEMPGAETTGWYPPYFVFKDCNMEGPGVLIDADAISEFHIDGNLQYIDQSFDGKSFNYINIRRGLHVFINNNTIAALPGSNLKAFVHIGRSSDGVFINHNIFILNPNAKAACGICVEPGVENIEIEHNFFEGPYTTSFARPSEWPRSVPREAVVR